MRKITTNILLASGLALFSTAKIRAQFQHNLNSETAENKKHTTDYSKILHDLDEQSKKINKKKMEILRKIMDEAQQKKNNETDKKPDILRQFREEAILRDLGIEDKNKDAFRKLFREYQDAQRKIKSQFKANFRPDNLSNAEAIAKLNESFDFGQKLLDNRREYSKKMQNILTPKQILKLFQNEGHTRDKIISRRLEIDGEVQPPPPIGE